MSKTALTPGTVAGVSRYFDAASGLPLHPAAREALLAALDDGWADPAKLYGAARRSRLLLDATRESIADNLGVRPDEVTFCASGTQAAHLAVLGALAARRRAGTRLLHSAVEHSAILHAAETHTATLAATSPPDPGTPAGGAKAGNAAGAAGARTGPAGGAAEPAARAGGRLGPVTVVPVDRWGVVDVAAYAAALGEGGVGLAALQSANHEVGTVQPVDAVAAHCAAAGVPLYVDAAQTAGWLPLPAGWSLASASAHKWGGPAGLGLLLVRKGTRFRYPGPADERESGRAPGFENVPAAVAAAAALRAVRAEAAAEDTRLRALTDRIRADLPRTIPDVEIVGHPTQRLPHLVTASFLYVDGEALLTELDRRGIAASSGSSCTSSTVRPSHVLEAMGVLSHGNLRLSLHRGTTEADVAALLAVLPEVVGAIRESAGVVGL